MWIESRSAEPLVRLEIFLMRTIRSANLVMLIVACGLFAMFYFNSLYVQRVLGYSPIEAGLAFVPFTIGIVIGAGLSQTLVKRIGLRSVGIIGMLLGTAGMLLFLRLDVGGDYVTDLLPGIVLVSIGMGMTFVPVTLIATSGIDAGDAGLASGLLNTSQQIGGALGLAILSTLATSKTTSSLESGADNAHALVDGFHIAYLAGAAFLFSGAVLLALMLKRSDVEQIDVDDVATVARLARLQGVQCDPERDREPAIDRPFDIAADVQVVRVAEAEAPVQVADVPLAGIDREVERDRHEVAVWNDVDQPAQDRDRQRPSWAIASACSAESRICHVERSRDLPKTFPSTPIFSPSGVVDVVAAADLHHRARLDPPELARLALVRVEADVLLDRHSLLPHERHGRRSGRDAIEVDHRLDQLVDHESVLGEPVGHAPPDSTRAR